MSAEERSGGEAGRPKPVEAPGPLGAPGVMGGRSNGKPDDKGLSETLDHAIDDLVEMGEYAKVLLAVRRDRAALRMRRFKAKVAIGSTAAIAGGAVMVTAGVLTVIGIARGLSLVLPQWLAELVTGVGLLAVAVAAVMLALRSAERRDLEKKRDDYERRHDEHRARFGHHVSGEAPASSREPR
ncbi:MAG TPA: phage holin family protein [Planctomycetota bacterium]|nr:phage holin family protein [Planctomycetota bacterium]